MARSFGETEIGGHDPRFKTTAWGTVIAARDEKDPYWLRQALDRLVGTYWRPIYAYVRREGHSVEDAKDLVQGFFASLIERQSLRQVSPDLGRFRSFLLGALRNYLCDHHDHETAQKRGGGAKIISFDASDEETLIAKRLSSESPEAAFEKSWALSVVRAAFERLKREYAQSSRGPTFAILEPYLNFAYAPETVSYSDGAQRLGVTLTNFRVMLFRARDRLRKLLSDEILQTVRDPSDVEPEIQSIMAALG